ncbi:hypothetical protein ABFS82_09G114000 [Erythranthe guttata]
MVLQFLKVSISGKKFLLILDDVWTEDYTKWESLKTCLKCGGAGSKILVTTRNKRVALMMGTVENEIHHLGHLSHEDCWLLLSRIAFFGKNKEECEKFHNIGKNIAKKCNGLPLAARALGSLLRFKNTLEDWETVLHSEIWELEEVEVDLFPHLLMSYNELSPILKRCFSYCAVFPKDTLIGVESLIRRWMAMGYLGSSRSNGETDDWKARGREYFDKLATRSLFQDFVKCDLHEQIDSFRMHDIIHDFARFLIKKNGGLMKKISCQTCSPLLVSHVKEYRSLFRYKELVDPHICDCLTSLRLLSLRECGLKSIPKEIEKLIHLRWLDLGRNKISNENFKNICKLYNLQFLWMDRCELQEIPHTLGNLIHLIHLNLGNNKISAEDLKTICKLYSLQFLSVDRCELQEIPQEIGNLIQLIHLDLSHNKLLKELPESICGLRELESLNVEGCTSLSGLPQEINKLVKLKHLYNYGIDSPRQFQQGLAELTNLVTLKKFLRCNGSKLGWLKNLNRLSGSLKLTIELSVDSLEEVVDDARKAELRKKMHIRNLQIHFSGSTGEVKAESIWMGLVEALEPNSNLKNLEIWHYKGSRFPRWIASPLNQLRSIKLGRCEFLSSLPSLGKLPLLENFEIWTNSELQFVGREFLGITTTTTITITTTTTAATRGIHSKEESSSKTCTNGFPKLHALKFYNCSKWKEWENITPEDEEEEYSGGVMLMPCLAELTIVNCKGLAELPHRLLRKAASSLKVLTMRRR